MRFGMSNGLKDNRSIYFTCYLSKVSLTFNRSFLSRSGET